VVIGTAGPDNQDFLRSLGIIPVRYGSALADRVRAAAPAPLTAVQDNHGREAVLAGVELGVRLERIVAIADHAAVAEMGLSSPGRYQRSAATLQRLAEGAASRLLRVPVKTYRLEDASAAYERLESGHGQGKVALRL
jgi:D-arabinose 1-dehydrogenase-like Zn-dependent alcohol dehydrogenase